MKLLDETVYYCKQKDPAGALLITGEWGSGKTYFIDYQLKKRLEGAYFIIRTSLFGMESVEQLKKEVKKNYIALSGNDKIDKNNPFIKHAGNFFKNLIPAVAENLDEPYKTIASSALSLDIFANLNISNTFCGMPVVLVFDDLERSAIKFEDLLGCLNEYCENLGFHVIIVANESYITNKGNNSKIYTTMKEKLVQRTLSFQSDYAAIINNLIDNMTFEKEAYKNFLVANKEKIVKVFNCNNSYTYKSGKEEIELFTPKNIRSLKCALQEFERIYNELESKKYDKISEFLESFISFIMVYKRYDLELKELYNATSNLYEFFFQEKYMPESISKMIMIGYFDEDSIRKDIDEIIERDMALSIADANKPLLMAKNHWIFELEDDEIAEGYDLLIEGAYEGLIELDEYIRLIRNYSLAKEMNIVLPKIEWNKIELGVKKKIKNMIARGQELKMRFYIDDIKALSPEQAKIYDLIVDYGRNGKYERDQNEESYITLISKSNFEAYKNLSGKEFESFSEQIMEATFEAFKNGNNQQKGELWQGFKGFWQKDFRVKNYDDTINNLNKLVGKLSELIDILETENKNIAIYHAKRFVEKVNEVIDTWEERNRDLSIS